MTISSTEQRPIFRDNLDNPLSYGRLKYFSLSAPSTLKAIYSNIERTVEQSNPVLLQADGRSEFQIFLGQGNYLVESYKFNGIDPNLDDDSSWSLENQWVEQGLESDSDTTGTQAVINTISELRNADPTAETSYSVLGYYAKGDLFPRQYTWNPASLELDNGGTIIRNPLYATGAWYMVVGDLVDVRIFGMLPAVVGSKNSQLASAVSWASASQNSSRTLYIPAGVYYLAGGSQNIPCATIIEDGSLFNCSGTFTATFTGFYDIKGVGSMTAGGSAEYFSPSFIGNTTSNEIYLEWFTKDTDYNTLVSASGNTPINKTLIVGKSYAHIAPSIITFTKVNIRFLSSFRFEPTQGIFEFDECTFEYNAYCLKESVGYTERFQFKNCESRLSMFNPALTFSGALSCFEVTTGQAPFVIDRDVTLDYVDDSRRIEWRYGLVTLVTNSPVVKLDSFVIPNDLRFAGSGGIAVKQDINFANFSFMTNPLLTALRSASNSTGVLDLNGQNVTLTENATLSVSSVERLIIRNGTITFGAYALTIGVGIDEIFFENVELDSSSTALVFTSSVDWLKFTNCLLFGELLSDTTEKVGQIDFVNCTTNGTLNAPTSVVMATNNRFTKNTAGATFSVGAGSQLTNNTFTGIDVKINPNSTNVVNGTISNNILNTTDTKYARIIVNGGTLGLVRGLSVCANSFVGDLTTSTDHIITAGTFESSNEHRLVVHGNVGNVQGNVVASNTIGMGRYSVVGASLVTSQWTLDLLNNPYIFYLPNTLARNTCIVNANSTTARTALGYFKESLSTSSASGLLTCTFENAAGSIGQTATVNVNFNLYSDY